MKNHDKKTPSDPLDANLSRLICKENLPPVPDEKTKAAILAGLREKQAELSAPKDLNSKSLWSSPFFLGGLAAALMTVLGLIFYHPPKPSEGLATSPLRSIPEVKAITYEAIAETKRFELRDGSTAIAEQGTRFIEVAPRQLKLEAGSLYLLVAKKEIPLEVVTPQGKALALGTRFLVSTKNADTRVAVAQGSVELVKTDDEKLILARGEEGVLASTEFTRRPAPRLSHLVSWARDSLRQEEGFDREEKSMRGLIAVDPQGQESRLSLREYTLDVFIENGVARTTIDQTFFNHYHSNTEGIFYFPLPPGAAVSRLAMYVNGVRNEGGMVERSRGQQIYNDIKYANRDPALLEQLEGNLYKLRIFPLEGRQEKRLFLSFTQNVDELYRTLRYWFPMDHTQDTAGKVKIRVRIKNGGELYEAESSTHEFLQSIDKGDLVLSYEAVDLKPDQDLLLKLIPKFAQKEIAETSTLKRDGQNFLHTRIRPDLEGGIDPKPRQWFVLNDTSASRSESDLKAQAHIIERLLAEADDEDLIAIANLNIDVERLMDEPVSLRDEKAKDALEKIRTARRIGGTNLAAGITVMREWIAKTGAANPHLIYLGDGLASDGAVSSRELTALLDKDIPFLGIAVGKKADLSFLRDAANATGGGAYLMNPDEDLNWRVFDMLASMNTPRLTGLTWDIAAYGDRRTLAAGEALTLVASTDEELPKQVTIRGSLAGEPWEKTIALEPTRTDATFISRFWAQKHLEELLKDGESHREEVVRLSKKHYVATPFTSLIVLENDKMYQDYKVEKGRKDHWAAYPAPDKIPVVCEPIPWHARSWGQSSKGAADDSKVVTEPGTAEEILETLLPPGHGLSGNATNSVRRHFYQGEGYYDLGLYDKAEEEFKDVIRLDPFNKAARRWMERCAAINADYYRAAYDHTRAQMLMEVDRAWELDIPPVEGKPPSINAPSDNRAKKRGAVGGGGEFSRNDHLGLPSKDGWNANLPRTTLFGRQTRSRGNVNRGGVIQSGSSRGRRAALGTGFGDGDSRFRPYYRPFIGDLTTAIPALATSDSDRTSVVEMKLGREKRGRISEEAAALIRAAEAQRKPLRLEGMIITPDGKVKGSETSAMYLEEETISDGTNWYHFYRELGFATMRPVTPTNLALIQASVPHWPPSFKEMEARWIVTLATKNEESFDLVLVDPANASHKLVLEISNNGLLLRDSHWKEEEKISSRSFDYESDIVTITNDLKNVQRYEAVEIEVAEALFAPDLDDLVVLDLPLRKPTFYEKKLVSLEKGKLEKKKQLLRHFIVSKALDQRYVRSLTTPILTTNHARHQLIQLGAGTTPAFDHRTLAAIIDIESAVTTGSEFLTHFKEVSLLSARGSLPLDKAGNFVGTWPESPYLLDVVQRCSDPQAWILLLDLPDYRAMAMEQVSKLAWPEGNALKARIADFLIADAKSGSPAIISKSVAHFLGREQPENANWMRLVEIYQKLGQDLAALDAPGVLALLDLAIKEKDQDLESRSLSLLQEEMNKPEEIVILADIFNSHGRHQKAVVLYQKSLAGIAEPDPSLLQKASLSAKQFDEKLSITWQRQALKKLSKAERSFNKAILSQHYAELIGRALVVGELGVAMELALEGYELLPDRHLLITRLASHFQKLGQETERWRWLSTIIDRNPKSAKASGAIGGWYENEEMLGRADEMYARSHSYDSAHPQWLVKRISALYRTGKFEEADDLYRELVKTPWAHQLKSLVPKTFRIPLVDPEKIDRLTTKDPGERWAEMDFNDQAWTERPTTFTSGDSNSPLWNSPFHTRQKFTVTRFPRKVVLQGRVNGADCEIYLNGTLVHQVKEKKSRASSSNNPFTITLPEHALGRLNIGENVLAIRYKKVGKNPRAYVELMQHFSQPQ